MVTAPGSRMSLSIDVVIPTHQGWELTESCLRHLRRQTVEHTVIVSDNASTDGTPDRVREACRHDRSIAIAHGLEDLCEVSAKPTRKKRSKKEQIKETVPGDEE